MAKSLDIFWSRFVSGDREAFQRIYEHYFPQLFAYSLGKLKDVGAAEDVVSEVFLKLLNYSNPGDIQQIENWLFTVTKNASLSYITKHQRRHEILQHLAEGRKTPEMPYSHQHDMQTLDHLLESTMKTEDFRLWKLHLDGFDNSEIAEKLEMNEKTVANRKTMLKNMVKDIITKMNREKDKG